jgi:TRAP-type mannitol/chloroaromatic compound transport system permease small subunit
MDKLRTFMMAVEKTNVFVGYMMAYTSIICVAVISFEVIMRYVFGMPTNWGHETMLTLFAMYYAMIAGTAHFYRAHVRVDVVYAARTRRTQAIMDLLTAPFFYTFVLVFIWTSWNFYWSSQMMNSGNTFLGIEIIGENSNTDWAPPLYPVKFLMPFGGVLLLLQGIVWTIRDIYTARTGKEMDA